MIIIELLIMYLLKMQSPAVKSFKDVSKKNLKNILIDVQRPVPSNCIMLHYYTII